MCLCFALAGLIPDDGTTGSDTLAPLSHDVAYLSCSADVQSACADWLEDIGGSLELPQPDPGTAWRWEPTWRDRILEVEAAHLACPTPSDERLKRHAQLVADSLAEYVLMADSLRAYCSTNDPELLTLAAEHMGRGFYHMNQAHGLLEEYRAQIP